MLISIQSRLIQWVLQPLARMKKRVPDKVWQVVGVLSVLGMILIQFLFGRGTLTGYLKVLVMFCCLLGLFILAGLKEDIKPLKLSPVLVICWFGVAGMTLISGILVEKNCLGDAMLWLIAFPVLFIVWGNRSIRELVGTVMGGIYLSFVICIVLNLLFFPVEKLHYTGFFLNSNSLAMYTIAVYVVALIDILSQERFGWRMLLADLVLGLTVMTVMYSNSRAGLYVMTITTVCGIVFFLTSRKMKLWKVALTHFLPAVLAVVIIMSSSAQLVHIGQKAGEFLTDTFSPKSSDTASNAQQAGAAVAPDDAQSFSKTEEAVKNSFEYTRDRLSQGQNEGLDRFTTGRVSLWKIYIKEVGLLGNPSSKVLYDAEGEPVVKSSHMTPLQMAYEYGVLAAVFFLILNITSGLKAVLYVYKKPEEKYVLFPVLIAITYGGYFLVEKLLYPATVLLMLLYMLSQAHMMPKLERASDK